MLDNFHFKLQRIPILSRPLADIDTDPSSSLIDIRYRTVQSPLDQANIV